MDPYKRAHYVSRLSSEIGCIGPTFEAFGGLVLNLALNVPVNTQGINLKGFAVPGVVDGVSPDGFYAAEYSALDKYFASPMVKAQSDVRHALTKAPHAKEIYLLAGANKAPQISQAFETSVLGWPEMAGRSLKVLGAAEIAAVIIDHALDSEEAVHRLSHYLPSLARFSEEEAAQALVPQPDPLRIPRPEVDGLLDDLFQAHRCVVLAGLGGSGKSDAAAAYAHRNRQNYQTVLWLSGSDIGRVEDLQAVSITRMGEMWNVAGLLKSRPCLVIIDDANDTLDPKLLSSLCGPDSHVLLTRRAVTASAHEIPLMSESDAHQLLTRNVTDCPSLTWDKIWQSVGGHPLTISLLNAAVCEGATWAEIELDCQMPGALESDGHALAERLLGRLRSASELGLAVFEWAGVPQVDAKLVMTLSAPGQVRTLRKYGLTAPTRPGLLRLHDIVYASLAGQHWWTQSNREQITNKFDDYMGAAALRTDLAFWSAALSLRAKIERLVEDGDCRPAFIYSMLSTWAPSKVRPELLGNPLQDAELLSKGVKKASPIATMALMETVEKLYLHDKNTSLSHAKQMLDQRFEVFDKLAIAKGLTIKQQSEIQHHKAKALVRLSRVAEALAIFDKVKAGPHPLPETEIQIMRLLKNGDLADQERAADIAKKILTDADASGLVSHSVFFAAVELATWLRRSDLIMPHEALITRMLVETAELGISQALQTMSSVCRFLSKEAPEFLIRLVTAIPAHVIDDLPLPGDRFAWADTQLEVSRIAVDSAESQRAESLRLFESLPPNSFHSQRHAELLLLMRRPQEAKDLLILRHDLDTNPFAQRLMALAEYQIGNFDAALEWIDRAFSNLKPNQSKYRYEFHEHRFDILASIPCALAVPEIEAAIESSAAGRERERLKSRLAEYLMSIN
ncbi:MULTISPECIES: ATP-binding protein [Pseudomonas]|uniref:ATP-binding protein n=1 Tax=Pseudomonas TaxID=286 RepID=UPI00257B581C|nr:MULTISPECIES: ATP-binding protein [Pseudomonas]